MENMWTYLHSQLDAFRYNGRYCDVIIRVQKEEFRCHRVILAAFFEYFEVMFGGAFLESRINEITLHGVKAAPFKVILDSVYTGRLPDLREDNIFDILRTVDFLGHSSLVDDCVASIRSSLPKLTNIVEVYGFACNHNLRPLVYDCALLIVQNFAIHSERNELIELSFFAIRILIADYAQPPAAFKTFWHIKDVDLLLDVILRWVYHCREERAAYFEKLCEYVNFECVSARYVTFVSDRYEIRYDGCHRSFKQCLLEHFVREPHEETLPVPVTPAPIPYSSSSPVYQSTIHTFVKYDSLDGRKFNGIFSLHEKDPRKCKVSLFEVKCPFTTARSVALGDDLYFFGCHSSAKRSPSSFLVYSSLSAFPDHYSRVLRCPPCNSTKFQMCGNADGIYWSNADPSNPKHYADLPSSVSASFSTAQIFRGIYRYECQLNKWFPVPQTRIFATGSCLVADSNRVYLIGGRNRVLAFDYRTPKWLELPITIFTYRNAVGCALNNKIYVSDGALVEMYDPVASKWKIISERYDSSCDIRTRTFVYEKRMVAFKNLLWQFNTELPMRFLNVPGTITGTGIIDPYDKISGKNWRTSWLLKNAICRGFKSNDDCFYDHGLFDHPADECEVAFDKQPRSGEVVLVDVAVFKHF